MFDVCTLLLQFSDEAPLEAIRRQVIGKRSIRFTDDEELDEVVDSFLEVVTNVLVAFDLRTAKLKQQSV